MKFFYYPVLLLLFVISFPNLLKGQTGTSSPVKLPEITPPSPEAAAFAKYGIIPVDYATGVPNISIPVYTIKSGQLEFPLSFSYHASGNKESDVASTVGLGWVFNGSGVITQVGMGGSIDGELTKPKYKTSQEIINAIAAIESLYPNNTDQRRRSAFQIMATNPYGLDETVNGSCDTQSDRCTFNFNGKSGVFRNDFLTGEINLIPYYPIKIDNFGNGYKIIDENGTTYIFDQKETSNIRYSNSKTYTYYLSSITSVDGVDSITFEYGTLSGYQTLYPQRTLSYGVNYSRETIESGGFTYTNEYEIPTVSDPIGNVSTTFNSGIKYLTKIKSKNTIVDLTYDATPRADFGLKRLDEIKIYVNNNGSNGELIKKVKLDNNLYFENLEKNNKRLKLNGLTFYDKNNNEGEKYRFEYDPTQLPQYFTNALQVWLNNSNNNNWPKVQTDIWGYYNGSYNSSPYPNSISGIDHLFNSNYSADRTSNLYYAQASILTKIYYPTGGRTEFTYSLNDTAGFGGLRINEIKSFTKDNVVGFVKSYSYGGLAVRSDNWSSNSVYRYEIPHIYTYNEVSLAFAYKSFNWSYINASPLYSFQEIIGQATYYNSVTETHGTANTNIGTTSYEYQYPNIVETIPESSESLRLNDYDWGVITPLLKEQKEYKVGVPNAVKTTTNTYGKVKEKVVFTGYKLVKAMNDYILNGGLGFINLEPEKYVKSFMFQDSHAYSERYNLINTAIVETLDNGNITSKNTNYTYNDYLQLASQTETIDGKVLKTTYKYPLEFAGTSPYNCMNALNYINPVIETNNYVNNVQTSKQLDNYKFVSPSMYKLDLIQTQKGVSDPMVDQINFLSYNSNGKPIEVSKADEPVISYLWGYNGQYPVAKIENATVAQAQVFISQGTLDNPTDDTALRTELKKIRAGLPNAMVTTYTYKPLIGATSMTDPKGYTVFYEYDDFGRLKQVKDADGKILSKNEYHYKNQ